MDQEFLKYGAWGGAVLGLSAFILILINWLKKKDDDHAKFMERINNEHTQRMEKIVNKVNDVIDDNTKASRETGNILTGLRTLIEYTNRKP